MNSYVIETRGLTKTYGEVNSVSNLSIHVKKGRIYGLLGRNGAGKTTTMRMLLGLTAPSSGEVKIWGRPLRGNEKKILPRIGSLIESPGFYPNLTGTENLRIFADLRGLKSSRFIKDALEVVNLPYRDKKLFSQYSLGMKQRLAIALAVMHNPELLILDEPINGLDPIGIAEMRGFIRELCDSTGKTILISSHILSEIALLADDIGIIDHGILLEEESLEELEAKNGKYFRFTVSNAPTAARLLEESDDRPSGQAGPGPGKDGSAVSLFHRVYGCRRPGQSGHRAGLRAGADRLLETVLRGNRPGDHDVGRGASMRSSGGASEPQLHYFCNHHLFLYDGQLYFQYQRLFSHAAVWIQSGDTAARAADLPLVLPVP